MSNEKKSAPLETLRRAVYEKARTKYTIQTLKNDPTIRAYRDFYWKLKIDPTKTRPSGEALLRRMLHGDDLPNISAAVDAYNLASLQTGIPVSGFDLDRLILPFEVRFSRNNEPFKGIGMRRPMLLTESTLILADEKQILCIYPYRDSDQTKIAIQTQNVAIVSYGVPKTTNEQLKEAVETALLYIHLAVGGKTGTARVFSPGSQ